MHSTTHRRTAFSLLELSALLVVIGLTLSTVLSISDSSTQRKTVEKAVDRRAEIVAAIDAYLTRNGRYPCVASYTQAPATATFGKEILADCTADTSTPGSTLRVETSGGSGNYVRIGAVPVRDLLLDDASMNDGYGNRYTYIVMEGLTKASTYSATTAALTVVDGAGASVATDAAYAVLSHGKDGKGAYRFESGSLKLACGATTNLDVENCDGDASLRLADFNETTTTAAMYNDDFLQYAPKGTPGGGGAPPDPDPDPDPDVCVPQDPLPSNPGVIKMTRSATTVYNVGMNAADLNNDGIEDLIAGAITSGWASTGWAYYGKASGWSTPTSMQGLVGASTGFEMSINRGVFGKGDINGDGYEDFVWSQSNNSAYSLFGKSSSSFADTQPIGSAPHGFQISMSPQVITDIEIGNINGDAYDDIIFSTYTNEGGQARLRYMYVVFGKADWSSVPNPLALNGTDGFSITSTPNSASYEIGYGNSDGNIGIGDVNGDGYDDIISYLADGSRVNLIQFIFFGKASGFSANYNDIYLSIPANVKTMTGTTRGSNATPSVTSGGDINNDGFEDIMFHHVNGQPTIMYGRSSWAPGSSATYASLIASGGGTTSFGGSGYTRMYMGNINNDAYDDAIWSNPDSSAIYILYGGASLGSSASANVSINGSSLPSGPVYIGGGWTANGFTVGDFNGDCIDDIAISATERDYFFTVFGSSSLSSVDLGSYF